MELATVLVSAQVYRNLHCQGSSQNTLQNRGAVRDEISILGFDYHSDHIKVKLKNKTGLSPLLPLWLEP